MLFIGITTSTDRFCDLSASERVYIDTLQNCNMTPVLLTNTADFIDTEIELSQLDGLVLIGGGDVHPSHYGCALDETIDYKDINDVRDACELQLARRAHEMNMPTLGICRGSQVMNVCLGGTLWPDVRVCGRTERNHQQSKPYTDCIQKVHIQPETMLHDLLFGTSTHTIDDIDWILDTNSMHHQAIRRPADSLYVNAITDDGLYEGIEDPSRTFYIGVQWHPEYLQNSRALFTGLRNACL